MYILITLAEPLQRDADERDENDGVSDPKKEEDSIIEERDINGFVGGEDKEDVNDPPHHHHRRRHRHRKFTYNMV